jgi:hypothetical protein
LKEGIDPEELITAAGHYAAHVISEKIEERYIKLAANFIGGDKTWKEYLSAKPTQRNPRSSQGCSRLQFNEAERAIIQAAEQAGRQRVAAQRATAVSQTSGAQAEMGPCRAS